MRTSFFEFRDEKLLLFLTVHKFSRIPHFFLSFLYFILSRRPFHIHCTHRALRFHGKGNGPGEWERERVSFLKLSTMATVNIHFLFIRKLVWNSYNERKLLLFKPGFWYGLSLQKHKFSENIPRDLLKQYSLSNVFQWFSYSNW